ncbi:MAG: hypothetical protein LV479_07790 [Methylacidiphilales bacterium]|nr:hypothetical protein [Candidatus Methylacidiphilales bacterium]
MTTDFNEELYYGAWETGAGGLPCFNLKAEEDHVPDAPFRHLFSTGHLSAMADRWGNVNLFTTEGGFLWLNSPYSALARGSLYMMMETGGELVSLLYSELTRKEGVRYGTGSIEYRGEIEIDSAHLHMVQQFFAVPDRNRRIYARFTLTNRSSEPFLGRLEIRGDATPMGNNRSNMSPHAARPDPDAPKGWSVFRERHEQLGDIYLATDEDWLSQPTGDTLRLTRETRIEPGASLTLCALTGYGPRGSHEIVVPALEEAHLLWAKRLKPFTVSAPEPWMARECLWNAGQLLSFTSYDSSVNEYYIALGGYGWDAFSVREVSETSMVLAGPDWDLAAASLRFVAKTQLASGDVPKIYNMRRDRKSHEYDSDNELWFVLGCCESVARSGRIEFLDEICSFWDGDSGTVWEHMKRAFHWVRDQIGLGQHGLILIREGDWNDYLATMGVRGRGESVMNSGMACRAFAAMAQLARTRGELTLVQELETYLANLRRAVAESFDCGWFRRGYTDSGRPVGSFAENRVFINAQSWPVLGKCGTREQRRTALKNAIAHCHTEIGLMLMSRPFSSPAPDDISRCAIPAGEGENAGIWPQTVHWLVWALTEEGLIDEALAEWKCGTLRSHALRFPTIPYGIFNGPDCFSSKWAGKREGGTQIQLLNRAQNVPMNPMIAWQGFTLQKINKCRKIPLM